LADFCDEHPEISPELTSRVIVPLFSKEDLMAAARAWGTAKKELDETWFNLVKDFGGGVKLEAYVSRERVCTRRVVGQREVTREVPVTTRTETVMEDVVEWDCPSLLLDETGAS